MTETDEKAIPALIKQLREAMGQISQEKLAREMDVSVRTISRYEDGSYVPTREKMASMVHLAFRNNAHELGVALARTVLDLVQKDASAVHTAVMGEVVRAGEVARFLGNEPPTSLLAQYAERLAEENLRRVISDPRTEEIIKMLDRIREQCELLKNPKLSLPQAAKAGRHIESTAAAIGDLLQGRPSQE